MGKPSRRPTARTGGDLLAAGTIDAAEAAIVDAVAQRYAVAVSPAMLDLIAPGDSTDPIARQFVPQVAELESGLDELSDPIGDDAHSPVKGIVHRYRDRVLLKPIHVCPVYCRFCFRREVVGPGAEALTTAELDAALDYIRRHDEIWEVILSGGDPLMLSPRRLRGIVAALDAVPHLGVIRLHTRVPVADPERVTPALIDALEAEKAVYVVLHCNHPREITPAARQACRAIQCAGIPMLSQSVLLRGVNDDAATLAALMRALVAARIKPYYLHHADLARGTGHFRTTIAEGQALMRALRGDVSGLCQPTYVLDIPGGHGKVPIGPSYLGPGRPEGTNIVEAPDGSGHVYPPGGDGSEVSDH